MLEAISLSFVGVALLFIPVVVGLLRFDAKNRQKLFSQLASEMGFSLEENPPSELSSERSSFRIFQTLCGFLRRSLF